MSAIPLLRAARAEGYAVGSFDVYNMESLQAAIAAAEDERSPVLVQAWAGTFRFGFTAPQTLSATAIALANRASVPVCLHLDHGETLDDVKAACEAGFTSVMIDASALPFEENIAATRQAVAIAHVRQIPVEAEIGHVGGESAESTNEGTLTALDDARAFADETGCDTLAVAIGTRHGHYQAPPTLDIDRLTAIAAVVDLPLVLHGSSYTPEDQIQEAIRHGIAKVNVATELHDVWLATAAEVMRNGTPPYPTAVLEACREAVRARIRAKMRLFGSSGRA